MPKLKLLVLHGYWPSAANPASTYAVEQVAAFARLGCDVTVAVARTFGRPSAAPLTIGAFGLDPEHVRIARFTTVRLPESLSSLPGGMGINTALAGDACVRGVGFLNRTFGPFDACIIHGARYFGWSLPRWRHLISGPVAVVAHGIEPFLEKPRNAERAGTILRNAAGSADTFIVVGAPLIGHLVSLGVPKEKIQVVWNGTVLPSRSDVSDRQRGLAGPRRIVSVSRLIAVKGIDQVLHALADLVVRRPDLLWSYRVVGDGTERLRLEDLTQELRLSERVRFLGMLAHADAMREITDADIFALPSWAEAFGLVYLEAMARMRPAIGCEGQGAADVIRHGRDGLLVPPHDPVALAAALERLIGSPSLCAQLGRAGRDTAEAFTWDANVRRILALLGLNEE